MSLFFQFFTFLIFTFYYSVVQLNVIVITIAFIIWSIWNAINDPLLGSISDRTTTKFISNVFGGFITLLIWGFGLAGVLIVRDVTISAIIDEDELNMGIRREAGYYGILGLFVKLTNVIIYITIALIFIGTDWALFDPSTIDTENILGLRSLMFIFPTIFLVFGILSMLFFPINKENYDKITEDARKLHLEKKIKIYLTLNM